MNFRNEFRERIKENIDYHALLQERPREHDLLTEILDLIVDTVCTSSRTIKISRDDKPVEIVKAQFLKLDGEHIQYVLDCLQKNTTMIQNMKQYLLASLYNAPLTIGNYYRSLVSHDLNSL